MDVSRWMTHSLRSLKWGEQVGRVLSAALAAVEPGAAVSMVLRREGNVLYAGETAYDLLRYRRIFLIGAGKAAVPMGYAASEKLGDRLTGGVLVTKDGHQGPAVYTKSSPLKVLTAGHPLPDDRGRRAADTLARLLSFAGEDDLVLFVLSGGGSALITDPVQGVSLDDLQTLTSDLLACGASIDEINTLRKHLDRLKGGRMAQLASPAMVITLILSDVIGNPLDVIASGPTAPDPTSFADALAVLNRYRLDEKCPSPIIHHLRKGLQGLIAETPKPGDPIFDHIQNHIVGSNHLAAQAASREAALLGWNNLILTTYLQGEARQVGPVLSAIARQVDATSEPLSRPACLIAGGETTVTIRGDGMGGRNQELALSAVTGLAGLNEAVLMTLATDGGDGPTDAAGAVVSGETLSRAYHLGIKPRDYLERNDAYHFFATLDDLFIIGPTLTNVNDLVLLFLGETYGRSNE